MGASLSLFFFPRTNLPPFPNSNSTWRTSVLPLSKCCKKAGARKSWHAEKFPRQSHVRARVQAPYFTTASPSEFRPPPLPTESGLAGKRCSTSWGGRQKGANCVPCHRSKRCTLLPAPLLGLASVTSKTIGMLRYYSNERVYSGELFYRETETTLGGEKCARLPVNIQYAVAPRKNIHKLSCGSFAVST